MSRVQISPSKRWVFILSLCVPVFVLLVAGSGCAKQDPDVLFKQAIVNAVSAHWDEALGDVKKALSANPGHLSSRILQGLCYHHLQDPEKAEETLRSAAQESPGDFAAQYFYGWIMCERGAYQDALPALRKAHILRPAHDDTVALLARCCLEQSLAEEGVGLFAGLRRNATYGKGAMVDNSIAILYLSQGNMVKAKNHLFAALRRDPDNPVIAQNLAVLHDQYLASPKEALRYYVVARNNSQKIGDKKRVALLSQRIASVAREM